MGLDDNALFILFGNLIKGLIKKIIGLSVVCDRVCNDID